MCFCVLHLFLFEGNVCVLGNERVGLWLIVGKPFSRMFLGAPPSPFVCVWLFEVGMVVVALLPETVFQVSFQQVSLFDRKV